MIAYVKVKHLYLNTILDIETTLKVEALPDYVEAQTEEAAVEETAKDEEATQEAAAEAAAAEESTEAKTEEAAVGKPAQDKEASQEAAAEAAEETSVLGSAVLPPPPTTASPPLSQLPAPGGRGLCQRHRPGDNLGNSVTTAERSAGSGPEGSRDTLT
jgi:hypothetical protein